LRDHFRHLTTAKKRKLVEVLTDPKDPTSLRREPRCSLPHGAT
jgi:hypothetical protein